MKQILIICFMLTNIMLLKSSPLMPLHGAKIFSTHPIDIEREWNLFKKIHKKTYQSQMTDQQR